MRSSRAQGYLIITSPDVGGLGVAKERDTFTCNHCGGLVIVDPGKDPATYGGWCGGCGKLICPKCEARKAQTLTCTTIEKKLEVAERQWRTRRSVDLVLD